MSVGLLHYLILAAILFSIGLFGLIQKRNASCRSMRLKGSFWPSSL